MISDHYILKHNPDHINKILDISEYMASANGFEKKDLLLIRLLTEEMVSAVQSALLLYNGEIWFGSEDGMFTITVSVNTDISGMPLEQRKQLKKMDASRKKTGLLGLVKEYMDFLMATDDNQSMYSYLDSNYKDYMGMHYTDAYDEVWHMNMDSARWYTPAPGKEDNIEEIDLEISLLQAFADDIRVTTKRSSLEITVKKSIPVLFMFNYMISK